MIVYRLSKEPFNHDLSGKSAELAGGRWNSMGIPILYTSKNRSLCTAEIAVHTPLGIVPKEYYLITIEINLETLEEIKLQDLPDNWKSSPSIPKTKEIGDHFIKKNASLVLKVPSAVVQEEYNYLVNPNHVLFSQVKILEIEPFKFDIRLFRKN